MNQRNHEQPTQEPRPTIPISAVKDALWAQAIYDSTVRRLKTGVLRVRRSYYYRPAEGLERYAARVAQALAPLGYTTTRVADEWAAWPKSSYFTVECRLANDRR